jgi:Tfp pilus assembly protein PilX
MRLRLTALARRIARDERGFTMVVALMVMLVGSLLAAAAFVATDEDAALTKTYSSQQKAYFAALAGVDEYKYQLVANPNYWLNCPTSENPANKAAKVPVPGTADEEYEVKTLGANGHTTCAAGEQKTIIETAGTASGTFRIQSTGFSGGKHRTIVATLSHPGFLNYVWESNFEVEDPETITPHPTVCAHYYKERVKEKTTSKCPDIPFIGGDALNGPFHTNDAVAICEFGGKPSFGRTSKDIIEMNQGHYEDTAFGCGGGLTLNGTLTENGATLYPPVTDNELLETAAKEYTFKGRTVIELNENKNTPYATPNEIKVTTCTKFTAPVSCANTQKLKFPPNGVIYVENEEGGECHVYSPFVYDKNYEEDETKPYCGNVYIRGTYTESLTVAAQNDVIITGSITTDHEASGKPTENATLGLIANGFVRIYHPTTKGSQNTKETCNATNQTEATDPRKWGAINNPTVDAAILSTEHSWIVDNFTCGAALGTLTVWGAIAQDWRGRVTGKPLVAGGYLKSYNYDERLKAKQPPSFLSPTTTSWHVTRETQPPE